jgi:ADP-ribosyl-[dinitrogen reductase] hydrolase
LLAQSGFDPRDQMGRYLNWWKWGYLSPTGSCFDIGMTVRAALERFERTGEPYSGSIEARAAGNGSLMRLAPVALFYAPNVDEVPSTLRRRSWHNFQTVYRPLADAWAVYDNSSRPPKLIESGR